MSCNTRLRGRRSRHRSKGPASIANESRSEDDSDSRKVHHPDEQIYEMWFRDYHLYNRLDQER